MANRALSIVRNVIAIAAALIGIPAFLYVFIYGYGYVSSLCEHPLCRIIGLYTYKVERLDEYLAYVRGEDLYRTHGASSLKFDCEKLRDQLADAYHQFTVKEIAEQLSWQQDGVMLKEVERLRLLGAWREGKTLHIANAVTVDRAQLSEWRSEWRDRLSSLVTSGNAAEGKEPIILVMRRLFDAVVLHVGNDQGRVSVRERWKCDP